MCKSVYAWSSISSVIVQAVNRQPLITEARVRSQAVLCWFVVDRLALGQTLLQVIQYSPVSIILPTLHIHFFHSRTVHLDIIKVFIYQLMHKGFALKDILKFTLKMFRHVSV